MSELDLLSVGSLPKWLQLSGLDQAKSGAWNSIHVSGRGPNTSIIVCCLPGRISSELDRKQTRQCLSQHSDLGYRVINSNLAHCPRTPAPSLIFRMFEHLPSVGCWEYSAEQGRHGPCPCGAFLLSNPANYYSGNCNRQSTV